LRAAVRLTEGGSPPAGLVLAGPTVAPGQRSVARLLMTAPLAYRRDSPAELRGLSDYRWGGRDVLTYLRSAVADRPELTIRGLTLPLIVTAGRHDAFAPAGWLGSLVRAASSRSARVIRLPGSHNNPFTQVAALASVVESADAASRGPRRARRARIATGPDARRSA
jgi:hypothetical protein